MSTRKVLCLGCSKYYERFKGGRRGLDVCSDECRLRYHVILLGGFWLGLGFCTVCNEPTTINHCHKPRLCCSITCQDLRNKLMILERKVLKENRDAMSSM